MDKLIQTQAAQWASQLTAMGMLTGSGQNFFDDKWWWWWFIVLTISFMAKLKGVRWHKAGVHCREWGVLVSMGTIFTFKLLTKWVLFLWRWWWKWWYCFRFMANLQSEVIELEFLEFSRGMSTISELDFAKILLRYTNLDRAQIDDCLERVRSRIPQERVGQLFFCTFLVICHTPKGLWFCTSCSRL